MGEFRMPSLGADMDAGTLIEWMVKEGDAIRRGDIVAVVGTDKADIEVEAFDSGTIERLLVRPGEKVPVGTPLALIADGEPTRVPEGEVAERLRPEEAAPPHLQEEPVEEIVAPPSAPTRPDSHVPVATPLVRHRAHELGVDLRTVQGTGERGAVTREDLSRAETRSKRPRITPRAKRTAAELGVDVSTIAGTGPAGAITEADVRAAADATGAPATGPGVTGPPAAQAADQALAMRRAIGALMARSKREIPHYYLTKDIDMTKSMRWLEDENEGRDVTGRLIPAALLLRAVALAAREMPEMNGFWVDDAFHPGDGVHIGVAVSLRAGGLIAPALHDADRKNLDELMAALRDLVRRARSGRLRSSEMSDPTITVTNLGDRGVDSVLGVIYAPQVALVGFGKIVERPWAEGGMIGVRPILSASLSADHRASDGHHGGRFLTAVDRLLQRPEEL